MANKPRKSQSTNKARASKAKKPASGNASRTAARQHAEETRAPQMPWIDNYPEGVDWHSSLEGNSLPGMFDHAVASWPDNVCTNFLGAQLTYADIGFMADRFAAGLLERGFGRGNRIGLFLPNCPFYVAAYFGILKTGATVVNFNPLYSVEELEHQARDSTITAMVTLDLSVLYDKVEKLAETGVIQTMIVCPFTDILPTFKALMFRLFKGRELTSVNDIRDHPATLAWSEISANNGEHTPAIIKPQEDVALLQYTGGTTGTPKGAMLTHANLTINVEQIIKWSPTLDLEGQRVMGILPFFHVFAMTTVLNFSIRMGAAMILMPKFDLDEAVSLIRQFNPTILPGVPTLYTALLNHGKLQQRDFAALKLSICGGAPLPLEVRRDFESFSGCRLVEGYGLSETSPVATVNPISGIEKNNSIGQPVPGTVISIRSLEDPAEPVPLNEPGEICIKGPQVMSGYWNQPEETANAFVDGYFRTGDIGYMDEDGFIFIIDRIKDMINCSGYKVYPRRVEDAIYEHPAVLEVSVVGIPDEYRGEAPKAYIKLRQGKSATEEEILAHLKTKLSKIEMPEEIEFRDELPKTMVGKLSKKDLRNQAAGSGARET